jgi:Putative transmembrane protein (PGPGW)
VNWLQANQVILWWVFSVSAAMFLGGLVGMPILLVRMRSDYFVEPRPGEESWGGRHPVARWTIFVVKNFIGLGLLLAGLAMLVLPGQGVITILVAISLLNFPGKRRLELRIVRQPPVLHAINWIRARAGRPLLILPDRE